MTEQTQSQTKNTLLAIFAATFLAVFSAMAIAAWFNPSLPKAGAHIEASSGNGATTASVACTDPSVGTSAGAHAHGSSASATTGHAGRGGFGGGVTSITNTAITDNSTNTTNNEAPLVDLTGAVGDVTLGDITADASGLLGDITGDITGDVGTTGSVPLLNIL